MSASMGVLNQMMTSMNIHVIMNGMIKNNMNITKLLLLKQGLDQSHLLVIQK